MECFYLVPGKRNAQEARDKHRLHKYPAGVQFVDTSGVLLRNIPAPQKDVHCEVQVRGIMSKTKTIGVVIGVRKQSL